PARGHVWRVGVASAAAGAANVAWPANQESAFRNPASFAALIFEDRNLAANGDVEAPAPNGQAPGWRYAYHPPEGKGVISVVPGGRPGGQQMLDLHKTDDYAWFPQLWSAMLPLQRGSTYRVSLWVKCDWPYLLRHTFFREGATQKQHHPMPAAPEWTRITNEFSAPPEFDQVSVGLMLPQREGHLYADDLTIERVNDAVALGASLPNPDPIHGLRELARRRRFKPYPLLREGDGYQTDRVIFRDTGTGTAVCKVTRSGGVHSRHGYMEMPPWNADGSRLLLGTGQLGKNSLLLPADASAWRFLPWYASSFQWDRLDPELMYYRIQEGGRWTVCRRRLGDPEPERLKTFDGEPGLWPPSPDGQKLLIKENFPAEKPPRSVIWLMDRNGRDFHPMYPPHEVHQTWFTKLPDYSVEYEYEDQAVRGNYRITRDSKVQTITEQTQGHRAHSPDGQWIAGIGRANLIRIDGKETRVLADVGTDHHTWKASNDWYAASSGRHLVRVGVDGSFGYQRVGSHNSSIKHSTYSSEAHPEMSADGTKIAYASNMLHDIEFYWHQMGLPAAPTGLTARRQGNGMALT
ncbi:MAG: hypothetical protein HUU35_19425, partial [Armatimonadetes bacterium]|nr:hypothetical protein [Armatimonadota bacterium]